GGEGAASVIDVVGNDRAVLKLQAKRRVDQLSRYLEQLLCERYELVGGQAAMPLVHGLGERVRDAGPDPDQRRLLDAELRRYLIGRHKPDAADIASQAVWVL